MIQRKIIISCYLILIATLFAFCIPERYSYNIIFIGDSITQASMIDSTKVYGPVPRAVDYLSASGKFKAIHFSNQGHSGFTTFDFLPSENKAFRDVIAAANVLNDSHSATLVFSIMLGTNDSAIKGPNGSPVAPDRYRINLKIIADSLMNRYPKCKIIINTPLWYSDSTRNRSTYFVEGRQRLQSYMSQIKVLVGLYSYSNPDHVFLGDTAGYNYFKENYLTDMNGEKGPSGVFYLHPNKKGAGVLGVLWGKALLKALD